MATSIIRATSMTSRMVHDREWRRIGSAGTAAVDTIPTAELRSINSNEEMIILCALVRLKGGITSLSESSDLGSDQGPTHLWNRSADCRCTLSCRPPAEGRD